MALLAYNRLTSSRTLAAGNPAPTLPASAVLGQRGAPVNVTSELRGLTSGQYDSIRTTDVSIVNGVQLEWTSDAEYTTNAALDALIGGPQPGPHVATHITTGTDPVPAGILAATAAGRGLTANDYFDQATALAKFATNSWDNAVLLKAVADGAFVADAATRALFADGIWTFAKLDAAMAATWTGAHSFQGAGGTTFDVSVPGAVTIDSSGGTIGIGTDAVAQAINVGVGAAARDITIGNVTGTSRTQVNAGTGVSGWTMTGAGTFTLTAGTGDINLATNATDHSTLLGSVTGTSALTLQAGTGAFTLTAGGAWDVNAAGAVTIDSSASTIGIGVDAVAQAINIGTGASARTIAIGNAASTAVNLNAIAIALTSVDALTLTDGTATLALGGTGATSLAGATTVDLDCTGAFSINSSAGAINIGDDAVAQAINIGTGAAARTITVGNAASTAVNLNAIAITLTTGNALTLTDGTATLALGGTGATSLAGATTVDLDCTGIFSINSSAGAINLGDDAVAQNINIGTGAAARTITVGNITPATAVVVNAGTGASSWTVTDGGTFDLVAGVGAINLASNGTVHSTTVGSLTGVSSTSVRSGSGGSTFTSTGTISISTPSAGGISIAAAGGDVSLSAGSIGSILLATDAAGAADSTINLQTVTFGIAANHNAVRVNPTWSANNFARNALYVTGTQNGANSSFVNGVQAAITKTAGATVLAGGAAFLAGTPAVAGTMTTSWGFYVSNMGTAGVTNAFGIQIASQSGAATTQRAIDLVGTGVANAIRLGGSPNLYSSAANTVRFTDATDAGGFVLTTAAAGGAMAIVALGANSSLAVDADGAGAANFGTAATAHTTTLGSANTTAATTIQSGTGMLNITALGNLALSATAGMLTVGIMDEQAVAWQIGEGARIYEAISTVGGAESMSFGNATTNPTYSFLGTGIVDINAACRASTFRADGDAGALAGTTGLTNVTAAPDATPATLSNTPTGIVAGNAAWIKVYIGAITAYIPYWTA